MDFYPRPVGARHALNAYRLAADVGGTFTDVVLADDRGALTVTKTLSTPPHFEHAVISGAKVVIDDAGCDAAMVTQVLHGTTAATNAVLERKGGPTGLITTRGFRDVLELRRLRMPELYNVFWTKPAPLAPRHLRREVAERIDASGSVVLALDDREVREVISELCAFGIKSLAVVLLNSYRNPVHERQIGDLARQEFPELPVSLSSEVLPEIGEYERTSTTVTNAYVMPVMTEYINALRDRLRETAIQGPVMIVQSSGGMMTSRVAARLPVASLESGPAAGVTAAQEVLRGLEIPDAVTFDMGGTTAKAALITNGLPAQTAEYEIGAPVSASSRLLKGGGYLLRMRATDIAEVGAGGGSLISIDRGGSLQVGPESAGSSPGPVCYGRGGKAPTVTDANVILGYLNPQHLLGGSLAIDRDSASRVFAAEVAAPLGLSVEESAYAVHVVCNAAMARAIRSVTTERGIDVRELSLLAFGGNGPVHAAELARSLGMTSIIVPPAPGLFSAVGLLASPLEQRAARTIIRRTSDVLPSELQVLFEELEGEVTAVLAEEDVPLRSLTFRRYADMRFADQVHELTVPVQGGVGDQDQLNRAFRGMHQDVYGYSSQEETEIVVLRVSAHFALSPIPADLRSLRSSVTGDERQRQAFFGPANWLTARLVSRHELGSPTDGPLIVEEYDSTVVVPPGCKAVADDRGNLRLSW